MNKNQQKTLSELADIRVSNVDKKTTAGEAPVFLCNYMDVYSSDYIRASHAFMEATASAAEISRFKVDKGDVLLTKDSETPDDIGIPAVVVDDVEKLVCGYHLALIKPQKNLIDSTYLCKWLGSNWIANYFAERATGSTRYGLSISALSNVKVHLPPLEVQQKISSILVKIDAAIEKTEALIEKYQQIKAGLMHDLFTRGVLPDGKLRPTREQAPELYRETGIGWVPKEWQIVALEGCLQSSPKNGYSPREIENWEGVYVLGLGCLTKEGFEPRQLKNAPRTAAIASGAMLNDGDFLISRANTPELVGLCGVYADVGVAAIYPDLMMRLSLVSILDARFLEAQMLYSETRIRLTALAVGTSSSMVKLNSASLKKFQLFLPALEEQKIIVGKLRIQQSLIDSEKKKLAKLRVIKNGLMHDLLTGKVAVKVDAPIEQEA